MRKWFVAAGVIFLSYSSLASADGAGVPVFAHYCNWLRKTPLHNNWADGKTLPLYSDGYCVKPVPPPDASEAERERYEAFDCFTGYDSLDPLTIRQHNAQMAAAGIVPLVSWWGRAGTPNAHAGDEFLDLYLAQASSVQAGILYEVAGLLSETKRSVGGFFDFGDGVTSENAQRFISDVTYLHERYFQKHPERFFTIDGRPVLFIWLSHAFAGRFDLAVAELRKRVPVYIIGSNFGIGPPPAKDPNFLSVVRGVDAISAYGIYSAELTVRYQGHMSRDYVHLYTVSVLQWNDWLCTNAPGVKLILPIQFTYHDSRGNPPLNKTTSEEALHLARTVRDFIDERYQKCTSVAPYTLLVSWSEHFEGSSVEPSREYGSSFLDIIRETFSVPLPVRAPCRLPNRPITPSN